MRPNYIKMPNTRQDIITASTMFYNIKQFPRVLGAVDGTHIRIQCPNKDEGERYRNRKGFFSFNVQGVSDAKLEFLDIVAKYVIL